MKNKEIRVGKVDLGKFPPGQAKTKEEFDRMAKTIKFNPPFPEGANVIVLTQVQTFNMPDTPGVRIDDVDHKGFKILFNELIRTKSDKSKEHEKISDGDHAPETIGYIAYDLNG